jgi:asparagine synthase (glutamine-hydrolysing)
MSAQFGTWQMDDGALSPEALDKAIQSLEPFGPDGGNHFIASPVAMFYRGLETTEESFSSSQPYESPSGNVVTWDGRLDNREELLRRLGPGSLCEASDVALVAQAYECMGTACFERFLGDWATAIWDRKRRWLLLARDCMGCRHLYYSVTARRASWSTVLDSLLAINNNAFDIEQEYLAGWLSLFPAAHLTPYRGIHAVPPSCLVRISASGVTIERYWEFDREKQISHADDRSYEEHFRTVLRASVQRRLRSCTPILAELSGGIDSSSIVCMADLLVDAGLAGSPKVETISYYNDTEPNWDERPYFHLVEVRRGRNGHHIDLSSQNPVAFAFEEGRFPATPGQSGKPTPAGQQFADIVRATSSRVLLSGIGGDEFTGGVPTPIPELADLVAGFRWKELFSQLQAWALQQRRPCWQLLGEVARRFAPPARMWQEQAQFPAWLHQDFARRYRFALAGYERRLRCFGPRPSLQEALLAVEVLRRQLSCFALPRDPAYETRYPYLDRDLLEFLLAVPRQQLVRPGRRRCLMRRALTGIVPDEVLNRKRKGFVLKAAITGLRGLPLAGMEKNLVLADLAVVDAARFKTAAARAQQGDDIAIVPLARALLLEAWLRVLLTWQPPAIELGRDTPRWADTPKRFNPAG